MSDTVNDLLVQYLETLRTRGESRLPIDESARESLIHWMKAARTGKTAAPRFSRQQSQEEVTRILRVRETPKEIIPAPEPEVEFTPDLSDNDVPEPEYREEVPPAAYPDDEDRLIIPNSSVEEILDYLKKKVINWKPVQKLGSLRNTMVFSVGNPHAALMLIGEAPGYQEERQQEPFVGPAGAKLTQILKAMGLERSDIYISNIVKFRPSLPNQTTNNRQPTEEEIASCLPFIQAEIRAIKPKAIVALGGTAAQGLLGRKGSINSLRGKFHEVEGIPTRVTYHPSYLLRTESNRDKRLVWEDMLSVMALLDMPISEKQKGYFLTRE